MTPGQITRLAILGRLSHAPAHGYKLHADLAKRGLVTDGPTGAVYRALHTMGAEGLVTSYWDTPDRGPAARVYELTPAGERYARGNHDALRRHLRSLRGVLADLGGLA